jgi:hypothetical protein
MSVGFVNFNDFTDLSRFSKNFRKLRGYPKIGKMKGQNP